MADIRKRIRYQRHNGILFPMAFPKKSISEVLQYKPQPDDNFIITYPKSGTTWMQHIAISIFQKGEPVEDYAKFNSLSPFFDVVGLEGVKKMPRPGAIKSHLPYNHMPYSPDSKYIFVARNPRDVCVSLYYHTIGNPRAGCQDTTFDDFFELFMAGEVEYNDYFDHLLFWYPHRYDRNTWHTTYEKMKADPQSVIYSVANFLGKEYTDAIEKDNAVMKNILLHTSFEYMKKNYKDSHHKREKFLDDAVQVAKDAENLQPSKVFPKKEQIRRGIVGDWKNHFSQEQITRLDAKFAERTRGTDLDTWWSY